jgi:hypothetical protein
VPTFAVADSEYQEQGPAVSALSDALLAANVEGWSAREIARRGDDRVSHSQLGKYLKPSHPRPGEYVLQVFSDVLRIPMPKLRQLAELPAGDPEPYEPPAEANRLDSRQRRVINELIRMLAETRAGDGDDDRDASSTKVTPIDRGAEMRRPQKRAARKTDDKE